MKIPKTVKICGLDYNVNLTDDLYKKGTVGGHNVNELTISLQKGVSQQFLEQTFVHECLHAIDYHYNNDGLKEEEVDRLANGIYQFLNDNKL